jgi:hypothetical protein
MTNSRYYFTIPQVAVRVTCTKTFYDLVLDAELIDEQGAMLLRPSFVSVLKWADKDDMFYFLANFFDDYCLGAEFDASIRELALPYDNSCLTRTF